MHWLMGKKHMKNTLDVMLGEESLLVYINKQD